MAFAYRTWGSSWGDSWLNSWGLAPVADTAKGGVGKKRRILPDGRQIVATEQEAVDTLLLYYHEQKLKPKQAAVLGLEPNRKKKVIITPKERVEILEALETIGTVEIRLPDSRGEEELLLFHLDD